MIAWPVRMAPRLMATAVVLVLALAVASCGSDDDGGGGDSAAAGDSPATSTTGGSSAGSSDRQQVEALFEQTKQAFADSDAKQVCASMAAAPKLQVVQTDPSAGNCEAVFKKLFKQGTITEDLDPELQEIKVNGRTAVATAKSGKKVARANFAKEDGDWKVVLWLTD